MFIERFNQFAEQHGDALAIVDGDVRITYRDLQTRKETFARFLRRERGVGAGDVVAACVPNCWEAVAGFLAAAEIGAIWSPVKTSWRTREIQWYLGHVPAACAVTNQELAERWLGAGVSPGRIVAVEDLDFRDASLSASDVAADVRPRCADQPLLYVITSGSTGRPRIVPRTPRQLLGGTDSVAAALGIRQGLRFLGVAPFEHAAGTITGMALPLSHGASICLMRQFFPRAFAAVVRREKIQVLVGSPFAYRLLSEQAPDREAFASVEISISTGAPMPPTVARQCRERLGLRVRQLYGSSEVGTLSIDPADGSEGEGVVGKLIPSAEIRILAVDGTEVAPGETGEIVGRSASTMSGYVGEPELNRTLFVEGFFRNGDLGRLNPDGSLVVTGRIKRLINTGGAKVDPREIEIVLAAIPDVAECRVFGLAGSGQAEIIKAQVVTRPGRTLTRASILEHCRRQLAEYKIPRAIEILDAFPVEVTDKTPVSWAEPGV